MLALVGGETANGPVRAFDAAIQDLYNGDASRDAERVAARLAAKAMAAVAALQPIVIRHGVDDLPAERDAFGGCDDWKLPVPPATADEIELRLRMDRVQRVIRESGDRTLRASLDPRYDVGWRHFDKVLSEIKDRLPLFSDPLRPVVGQHLAGLRRLRKKAGGHPKIAAVCAAVHAKADSGKKVVVFCHHHATAQEFTLCLHERFGPRTLPPMPERDRWRAAWNALLPTVDPEVEEPRLRETFIDWLCEDLIRRQTWKWLQRDGFGEDRLLEGLTNCIARDPRSSYTVAEAAKSLFHALLASSSSRAVLRAADSDIGYLAGGNGASQVIGVCEPTRNRAHDRLFLYDQQPDTILAIFNSPFGPDVLVVTDKLSEGVDLHRYCSHLVHYELDPSPIRTVQRNGRLRRVNCWAAIIKEPIQYAYPAFAGTRDQRLVAIMKKRINNFALLLGGVQDFEVDEMSGSQEEWRNTVVALARKELERAGAQLRARDLDADV